MRVIVIGAGGHGQVVADALLASQSTCPELRLLGYADDDERLWGQPLAGLPVLGPIAAIRDIPHDAIIVAIGDNRIRCQAIKNLAAQGEAFISAIHPAATVSPSAQISPGCMVLAGAVVNTAVCLGAGVIINTCASVDHHSQLGDYAHLAPGAHTGGRVTIAQGAFIGLGASIVPQRHIGAWAVIGAGATVIHDVPAGATVVGTPAHIVNQIEVQH